MKTENITEIINKEAIALCKIYNNQLTDEESTRSIGFLRIRKALERMYIIGVNEVEQYIREKSL